MSEGATFLLPDGKVTRSSDLYIRTWRSLGRKLIRLLGEDGWYLWAWDPDVCLRHRDGRHFDCPRWLALRLSSIKVEA